MEVPSVSSMHGFARSLPAKLERLVDAEDNNNGVRLSKEEKKMIRLLKNQLKQISECLMDPSEVEFPASAAKCWLAEVRELSYDIDDFHDELFNNCQVFHNNPHGSKHMKRRKRWISSEVSRLRIRLEKAIQRYKTYSLQESKKCEQSCITSFDDEHPPPPLFGFEDERPIGIDDSMEKVQNWLTDEGEPKRRVVAVVGLGGVGKTTLVNELYRNLRKKFECRAFVRSSQMPDMRELLTSILLQVRPHGPLDVSESCNLTQTIRTHLQHKKYFIVIDGLWALSTWDLILEALPDDNCFSRILTTTELDAVAHRCCGHNCNYMLRMEPLSKDMAQELFFNRFDGKQHEFFESSTEVSSKTTNFIEEISSEIVSKCGGFPLAIVSISSLLTRQPQAKIEKWNYIWSSLSSNLRTNPTAEGMKQVLSLCYNSLPDHLKTCMLYLCIYKQGHIIRKDDLVKKWIAEGFICAKEEDIEEVASTYFDELVTKAMVQPVHNNHNGQVISCTVHYMILQLIQCKSIEENFVITIHHSDTNIRLGDKVRRLSLHFGAAEDAKPPNKLELSQVRTLAFYGLYRCMPSLAEFQLLRVIILDLWSDHDYIKFELPTFCKLGYLEIACNVKLVLQIQPQGLQYLQTLKIDSRSSEVPQDIVGLPRLLHLSLPQDTVLTLHDTNLPNCIGHMSSLRTFGCFNLSSNSANNVQSLDKLTNLRDLRLTSSTMLCDNLEENFGILSSVLPKLTNLKSLTLLPAENSSRANSLGASLSDKNIPCDRLLTVSPPPALLEKLELSPRICIFSRLPVWTGDLGNISILRIATKELSQSDIDILKKLHALSALLLYVMIAPPEKIVFQEGFPVLKNFKFVCSTLCIVFGKGAMLNLRRLKLGFNTNRLDHYSLAEAGIENLKCLSVFSAKIGCASAPEHGRGTQAKLEDALRSGERQPIINIDLVDRVFDSDKEMSRVGKTEEGQTLQKSVVLIAGGKGPSETYQTGDKDSSPAVEISGDGIRIPLPTDSSSSTGSQGPRRNPNLWAYKDLSLQTDQGSTQIEESHESHVTAKSPPAKEGRAILPDVDKTKQYGERTPGLSYSPSYKPSSDRRHDHILWAYKDLSPQRDQGSTEIEESHESHTTAKSPGKESGAMFPYEDKIKQTPGLSYSPSYLPSSDRSHDHILWAYKDLSPQRDQGSTEIEESHESHTTAKSSGKESGAMFPYEDKMKQTPGLSYSPSYLPSSGKNKLKKNKANDIFDEFEYEALHRRAKKNEHITCMRSPLPLSARSRSRALLSAPMSERAASLVVGPLVSLLNDKVSSSLLDQYNVMEGMEKQRKILECKLPAILDIMADAMKQLSRQGVMAWLQELRMVAYEANDVFDEFEYEALRRRAKKNGHITKLGMAGVKLFPTHNRVAFRIRMGNKLSSIVEAIKVLVEEMKAFGFDKLQPEAPAWKEWCQTDSIIVDHEKIVSRSRDKEREKIIEVLLSHQASSGDLLVLPIVGMGGLGKTTLAQLIYNDPRVQEHFQLLNWVCVSNDFDVRNLAIKICDCDASKTTLEKALNKLQEHLRGKRYLLVLDDVWNKDIDKWGKFKACLNQGGVGSAILITTRDKGTAEFMGTVPNNSSWKNKYHDVAILDIEFIYEIIETRAFGLQKTKPEELVKLVGPIAERCHGSPLAAKVLGSVLCTKTTKEEWEDILHQSSICDDKTSIFPILMLSYDDLPTDMKKCFAFCAMYPMDYQIDVEELIQLWMANGYISDQNKLPAETMGKRIVNKMVSRSFFQYEEQRRIGYSSTSFVKIHDLMHDVAMFASGNDYVCITDKFIQSGKMVPSVARHIQFQRSTNNKELNFLFGTMKEKFPPIQTMMFHRFYHREDLLHSSKFSSLRALSMSGSGAHLSIKPKHLCHLRYLDLSYNDGIEALPDDISILYSLQTLKLSNCSSLKKLPEQMKHMSSLRHLYTDGCTKLECMPPELGRITSLRTITWFVVGSGLNCSSLGELKDLNIGGSLMLKQLENVTVRRNVKAANLENKKELRQLSLRWTSGKEVEQQCHEVLESLEAHDRLLALEIYSYQGTSFPSWLGMLKNMVELRLSNCSKADQLPELCQLAELQVLHLEGLGKLQFLCSSCTSSTFGKLKDLKLVNLQVFDRFWEATHGGIVAFPQLEILHIKGCENLAALPEASVLREQYGGGDYTVARSAFPELKKIKLKDLYSFERWESAPEIEEEHALFPLLEFVVIKKCPKLTTLPRAPKVKELVLHEANQQICLGGIRYMTSLSSLLLQGIKLDDKEEWDHPSSVVDMELYSCSLFFQPRALALWVCYGQLQDLTIDSCDELVFWPEKVFQSLISLRMLRISECNNLIGYAAANAPEQETSGRSQLLPHLEFLEIFLCGSLVEVFNSPALKTMHVGGCCKLESLYSRQQLNQEVSSTHDVAASTPVEEKLSPSADLDKLLPSSLESLTIWSCDGLSEVVNLPSSLREIRIRGCSKLRFMSGQLDALKSLVIIVCPELRSLESLCIIDLSALEVLDLRNCKSLSSLPSGPELQKYSCLRRLIISGCPGIKSLPSALQQRLERGLEYTYLDSRLIGRFPRLLGRLCPRS